ncbi:unnamed protein product [Sphagnum tenellum]
MECRCGEARAGEEEEDCARARGRGAPATAARHPRTGRNASASAVGLLNRAVWVSRRGRASGGETNERTGNPRCQI